MEGLTLKYVTPIIKTFESRANSKFHTLNLNSMKIILNLLFFATVTDTPKLTDH